MAGDPLNKTFNRMLNEIHDEYELLPKYLRFEAGPRAPGRDAVPRHRERVYFLTSIRPIPAAWTGRRARQNPGREMGPRHLPTRHQPPVAPQPQRVRRTAAALPRHTQLQGAVRPAAPERPAAAPAAAPPSQQPRPQPRPARSLLEDRIPRGSRRRRRSRARGGRRRARADAARPGAAAAHAAHCASGCTRYAARSPACRGTAGWCRGVTLAHSRRGLWRRLRRWTGVRSSRDSRHPTTANCQFRAPPPPPLPAGSASPTQRGLTSGPSTALPRHALPCRQTAQRSTQRRDGSPLARAADPPPPRCTGPYARA